MAKTCIIIANHLSPMLDHFEILRFFEFFGIIKKFVHHSLGSESMAVVEMGECSALQVYRTLQGKEWAGSVVELDYIEYEVEDDYSKIISFQRTEG